MLYRWVIDFEDIERRLTDDAHKLLSKLETWLDGERNTAYYTCDNNCGRYTFDMASGYTCGYEFVCPVCKQSLHYDDTSELTDTMQGKISELRPTSTPSSIRRTRRFLNLSRQKKNKDASSRVNSASFLFLDVPPVEDPRVLEMETSSTPAERLSRRAVRSGLPGAGDCRRNIVGLIAEI